MNDILHCDILGLAEEKELFNCIKDNETILITGATGLLGGIFTKSLIEFCNREKKNVNIVLHVRDVKRASSLFNHKNIFYIEGDISNKFQYAGYVDYIIHFACATSSQSFVNQPVDTISSIIDGTKNILDFAVEKQVKSMVFLSSLEVYGTPTTEKILMSESDYGYLDCTSVRSSYSEGKRLAETLCIAYFKQYSVPVKIARLCQTFGAGVSYNDNRVFASFTKDIINDKNIVLKTQGLTLRNYCYTTDAIRAIWVLLGKGSNGEAYNIANKEFSLTIIDMANYLVSKFGKNSQVILDIDQSAESLGFNPEMRILLDTTKIENLGWKALVNQEDAFYRLINSMILDGKEII